MDKFSDKKSLLDFLKKHWGNGEPMDEANFHMTWDVIVRNLRFDDGVNPDVAITDNEDGTHTITITNYDGTTTSAVIHDGKNGVNGQDGKDGINGKDGFSPEVTITDNEDGTHTITISKPDGATASTVIHDGKNGTNGKDGLNGTDGKDGFSPEISITDNNDGTHTITISKPDGTTASTVIHDGKNGVNGQDGKDGINGKDGFSPEISIADNNDGTHTLTITKPGGTTASTVIHDGKNGQDGAKGDKGDKGDKGEPGFSPEVTIADNNDGTHTLTITKPGGTTASTVIHDGKNGANGQDGKDGAKGDKGDAGAPGFSPEVTITDGTDGTHTLTITKPGGSTTSTVIRDGQDGKDGKDGAKGDKGDAGAPGFSPEVTITDGAGTHTLTITKPGGSTSTVIKDGKDGTPGDKGDKGDKGDAGAPGFSPEVTITDGDGTHTLTITKPDGATASTVIKDGKDGADGADGKDGASGFSLTSPIDSNGIALVPYSHTYYPLHGIDVDDSSQKDVYPKYTPDMKVEVNSVAIPASEFTGLTEEQASNGWKAGFIPSSYVITMYSNNLNYTGKSSNGEFHFDIDNLGFVTEQELDIPIDTLKLPTAEKTEKPIHELGFVSNMLYDENSRHQDHQDETPAVFMKYPETFHIPVFVKEKKADGTDADIKNKYATICLMPDYNEMLQRPILSNDIYTGFIAGMSMDYKQIDGTNLYHYTWAKETLFVPLTATLLTWDESTGKIGDIYKKQSTDATQVVAEVINETRALNINNAYQTNPGLVYNALQANSTGREIMRLFIGNPNAYGLLALD